MAVAALGRDAGTSVAPGNGASPSSSTARPSPSSRATGGVQLADGRLVKPISYSEGQIQFAPPPTNFQPRYSAADALKTVNDYARVDGADVKIFLASLTDYSRSDSVDTSTRTFRPDIADRVVWVILQQQVPSAPNLPGKAGGARRHAPRPSRPEKHVVEDVFDMVDASTNLIVIGEITSAPDQPAATSAPSLCDAGRGGPSPPPEKIPPLCRSSTHR